ncbi:MAG TPA: Asp-tRNA(Asn)/Glu-tRNA(Gln) amidotransferase subunit GatB [Terriglobia bacterium]|nr:Asp-tRNA(Asn)/Glu-tRNA(Gln) amidotransferase subunit GatB [Terriglobia bacterium]
MGVVTEVQAKYEAVIGLEVHLQLLTKSKIFCPCSTRFGDPPNSNTCMVCLGLPGALPVLNREAVTMAMKAATALNCVINPESRFARKNYFYPDLPKGYQISQYDEPLAEHGHLDIEVGGERKSIGITRVHLEDDAGKSLHEGFPDSDTRTYIDLNRSGVPLIEIVGEPELRTPEEAHEYLTRLKTLMLYLEVSNCNMEEGSLRCDANVSVRPAGATQFGTKAEVKNLNSFKFLQKALAYEIERQIDVVSSGGSVSQETRLWDSREQRTYGMRSKEFAHDYRYFPEPDLLPLIISDTWKEEIRQSLPELPEARKARFTRGYALPEYDAAQLISSKSLAGYYEEVVKTSDEPKVAANWVLNELLFLLKAGQKEIPESPVSAQNLGELLILINNGTVSGKMAKEILGEMFSTGRRAEEVMAEKGLAQINEPEKIAVVTRQIMASNPKQVEQYRSGKTATFGWFVGQVMKATGGQANPKLVQEVLKKELAE